MNPLRFESDEERNLSQINSANAFVDAVVKEGYLTVLPGEGIMENIRVRTNSRWRVVRLADNCTCSG